MTPRALAEFLDVGSSVVHCFAMRLSLLQRIGLLILAVLPVAWGNCPGWFDGRGACGEAAAKGSKQEGAARALCPCCEKRSRDGRPLRGCDDCPIVAVRRTASPVPASVVLPPPALIGLFVAPRAGVPVTLEVIAVSSDDASPPAGPPGLVGTVVLVV